MKNIKITYTKLVLILITLILCFAILSIIIYRLTAPYSLNFEQRLNTELEVITTDTFDFEDNVITRNLDGTITYTIYSYIPTDADLEILARYFSISKDKIIVEYEYDYDKSFYNQDPALDNL